MDAKSSLRAIAPVDGRYRAVCEPLSEYFSEAAIIRYRVRVEVAYLLALSRIPLPNRAAINDNEDIDLLQSLWESFSLDQAEQVKVIEKRINHDVKAVEYYIREALAGSRLEAWTEFIHFGLTSQDINNTAFPMATRDAWEHCLSPALQGILDQLINQACAWKEIPMLARTHGQPASPTLLGKEIYVFHERLSRQLEMVSALPFSGKFGGATGNFNAHQAAYPRIDWPAFADAFLQKHLGLVRQQTTTQIEHYDGLAAFFDGLRRINTILIDLCRDMWTYISMDYFRQRINKDEVGSSAMPHKVNPIDFENAEGNLGLANALFGHLSEKLPLSRLQRDLTDSTVIRNIGLPMAHTLIALNSIKKGLNKLQLHEARMAADLEDNWAVLAEAIQTILRREGVHDPYGRLKDLTRVEGKIGPKVLHDFIQGLDLNEGVKTELLNLTPISYTGVHPWLGKCKDSDSQDA